MLHIASLMMLPFAGTVITIIAVWSIFWKILALWHAARRGQAWWFVALALLNTLGILELVYLFGILKVPARDLLIKFGKTTSSNGKNAPTNSAA